MLSADRRLGSRFPVEMYLNAYVNDRQQRGFTLNISSTGLYLNMLQRDPLPPRTRVGLEFALPGIPETIWAGGEICYEKAKDEYFLGQGIRFTAMATLHARMIKEFCRQIHRDKWRRGPSGPPFGSKAPAGGASGLKAATSAAAGRRTGAARA